RCSAACAPLRRCTMSRSALAILLCAVACGGVAGDDAATDDASSNPFSISPPSATIAAAVGTAPGPVAVTLSDKVKKGHNFSVSCTGGAASTPASGRVSSAHTA